MRPTAILLVAFGAMSPSARAAYSAFEAEVRAVFPGHEIRWAYTATTLVARLKAKGEAAQTLDEAYAGLAADGFTDVAVCSLHLVPGEKHQEVVDAPRHGLRVAVGEPLLSSPEAIRGVAASLVQDAPVDRPVLVVAHGHAHEARFNAELMALKAELARLRSDVHQALLEGDEDEAGLEAFIKQAQAQGKAHVVPFLLVAGDHVQNDILGDEPDSFRSRLSVPDFTCGEALGLKPWARKHFRDRLDAALAELEHA